MADGRHIGLEHRFLAIYQRFIVRLLRNLIWRSRITRMHGSALCCVRSHSRSIWKM